MASIFLSHSSEDRATALRIADWLRREEHWSLFLDADPDDGLRGGVRWERELYQQLRSCQAVVVLCSEPANRSKWVFAEASLAKLLGKFVLPVRIGPAGVPSILSELQVVDLTTHSPEAYRRLADALVAAGLDPRGRFRSDGRRPPYPGLLAFQEADAAVFFGRDTEISELHENLRSLREFGGPRMVLVLGASGSGKSSLVRAGLLPNLALDPETWLVLPPFRPRPRPRADPVRELAGTLAQALQRHGGDVEVGTVHARLLGALDGAGERCAVLNPLVEELRRVAGTPHATVLLVVDQLEELLTHGGRGAAEGFVRLLDAALAEPATPLMVLGTLRSDYLGALQQSPAAEIAYRTFTLGPLARDQWARIIEGPAERAGLLLEPGLVVAMVRDTEREDALPLLAFALRELWEGYGRNDGELTLDEYRTGLGGLTRAVARAAEAVFTAHRPTDRQVAELRTAFVTCLATVDEQGQFVRRTARWEELTPEIRPILERFVDARLLVRRQTAGVLELEVAHEALLRSWDRLRGWLEDDRVFVQGLRRLRTALQEWEHAGRSSDLLLRGAYLASAREWLAERATDLSRAEREFIARSMDARKRAQRQRWFARVAVMAAVAAVPLLALIGWRASEAQRRFRATALVSAASLEPDPVVAALLLTELLCDRPFPLDRLLCHAEPPGGAAIARQIVDRAGGRLPRQVLEPAAGTFRAAALTADGIRTVTASESGTLRVWKADRSAAPLVLSGHTAPVGSAAFGPGHRELLTASQDGSVRVWDAATGRVVEVFEARAPAASAVFSADGGWIAAGYLDGSVRVWRRGLPAEARVFYAEPDERIVAVALGPDASLLAAGSTSGTVRVWRLEEPTTEAVVQDLGSAVYSVVFVGGRTRLALGLADGTARVCGPALDDCTTVARHAGPVWQVAGGVDDATLTTASQDGTATVRRLDGPAAAAVVLNPGAGPVVATALGADRRRVLTATLDGAAQVWEVDRGGEPLTAFGHTAPVWTVAFSPDRRRVVTASDDGTARSWDLDDAAAAAVSGFRGGAVHTAGFSPDGLRIAAGSQDGVVHVCAVVLTACRDVLTHQGTVWEVGFSPDGEYVVAASDDGRVQIGRADLSREPLLLGRHAAAVRTAAFAPDGAHVLTASLDETARVWPLERDRSPVVFAGHRGPVMHAAFGRRGDRVATASLDSTVRIWRSDTGAGLALFRHPTEVHRLAFSADGQTIATAGGDHVVRLWRAQRPGQPLVLGRHEARIRGLEFSPDGHRVLTASEDGTARAWAVGGRSSPLVLDVGSPVHNAAFSPDGRLVATASEDGVLRVWRADWTALLAYLRGATSLCLTAEQRARLLNEADEDARRATARCRTRYGSG